MKKKKKEAADVQGLAAKRIKKASIELMHGYNVNIFRLLNSNRRSAFTHFVVVPNELVDGIDEVLCTLSYCLEEPHKFKIPLKKEVLNNRTKIDVDSLCKAVAIEYKALDEAEALLVLAISELYIVGMRIKDNKLIVDIDVY